MEKIRDKIIISKFIDFNLIKFPIFFPIFYGFFLYLYPSLENFLIFFTLVLLAEPHFGATWPFFISKDNFNWIVENKINLVIVPISIVVMSLIGFFKFNELFLLIFFVSNIYHVTRQSYGVCKLYNKSEKELKFQELAIYGVNILYFIVAFFRFYYPIINLDHLVLLNIMIISLIIILSFFYLKEFRFSENFLVFLTGVIIFLPLCFVSKPIHGIIMGVTMHYTQYLALTYVVTLKRKVKIKKDSQKNFGYIFLILFYGLIMGLLSASGKLNNEMMKNLIVIPIIGQMLHFYIDSQLWKFSLKHHRDVTLKYL